MYKVLILLVFVLSSAFGQLVQYQLTTDGTPSILDADFGAGSLESSAALTYGSNGAFRNTWSIVGLDITNHMEIKVFPLNGNDLNITAIDFSERRSGTGPRNFNVVTSTDDFLLDSASIYTAAVPDDTNERPHSIESLSINVLSGDTLWIRFVGYNAEAAGGTWRLNDNSLNVTGSLSGGSPTIAFASTPALADSSRTTATLAWAATDSSTSRIRWGTVSGTYTDSLTLTDSLATDSAFLTGLTADTEYFYNVSLYATEFVDDTTLAEQIFSTVPSLSFTASPDTTVVNIATATIAWTSNLPATGQVIYGTSLAYGDTIDFSPAQTVGSVNVTGLTANTLYNYKVALIYYNGSDTTESVNATFTTDVDAGQLQFGDIVVSEVMYDVSNSEEWIELYNTTVDTLDISGIYITDDGSKPAATEGDLVIPAGTQLLPNQYLVVSWGAGLPEITGDLVVLPTRGFRAAGPALSNSGDNIAIFSDSTGSAILIDGSLSVNFTDASSNGTSIERNISNNYADSWSGSTYNFGGTIHQFATPGLRNSNDTDVLTATALSLSDLNLANDAGTYRLLSITLASTDTLEIDSLRITNVGTSDLSDVASIDLRLGSTVIGTINTPSVNILTFDLNSIRDLFANTTDTLHLDVTFGTFTQNENYQFEVSSSSDFVLSQYFEVTSATYPLVGPAADFSLLYTISAVSAPSPSIVASTQSWQGYFSVNQVNTINSISINNRVLSGTVDASDIHSLRIYVTNNTLDPTAGVPTDTAVFVDDASGGGATVTFGVPQLTSGNFFHIVYVLESSVNTANSIGTSLDTLVLLNPMTLNGSFPIQLLNDVTLPVSLAPMSYSDNGKAGLELVVKTYSEASPSVLRLMRSAGEELVQIAEFETNGSVSHGKEYVFTDKTAAYGREYTYTLYENNVLTDKSLTLQRVPNSAEISSAFPNPFNPTTAVQVNLPERSTIDVAVYNIIGQVVYQTQLTNVPVGQLTLPWNGRNANGTAVASGIYFFRVTIQGASGLTSLNKIQKIVLVK